jgi:DNA topoisomerase-1
LAVTLKKGPYGHYVQLGEGNGEFKPKRVALPRSLKPSEVDLETALRLLALPRELGRHPDTGDAIVAGIGRFGAYIKHGTTFKSLGADDDVLTIGLNRAVVMLAEPSSTQRRGPQLVREIGAHPEGGTVGLYRGRYGPYISHDGVIASLPRNANPDTFSLAEALPLLAAQRDKGKKRGRKTAKAAKNGAATEATKKTKTAKRTAAAKKTAATKTSASRSMAKTPRARPGPAPR